MDQGSLTQFELLFKVLEFFGYWQPQSASKSLKIRRFISHSFFALMTLILPIITYKFFESSFDEVSGIMSFYFATNLKILIFTFQKQKFVQIYEDLKVIIELTKSDRTPDRVHLRKQRMFMKRIIKFFLAAIAFVNISDLTSSIYARRVPYRYWIPYKLQFVVDHVDLFSVVQVLMNTSAQLITFSLEVLPSFFIGTCSVLLLELSERMEGFSDETANEDESSLELKTCVQLHHKISEFVSKVEKQFSAMLFIQGLFSSIFICFYVFYLSKVRFWLLSKSKLLLVSCRSKMFCF
jgi:hypothetical protein